MSATGAWVDARERCLAVGTYVADPVKRGQATRFSVTHLPTLAVRVACDGDSFERWTADGRSTITLETDVDAHAFVIEW